jgi:protein TonB
VQKVVSKPLKQTRVQSASSKKSRPVQNTPVDNVVKHNGALEKSPNEQSDAEQAAHKKTANDSPSVLVIDYRALNYREPPKQPNYPRMAKRRGFEGMVMLMLHISSTGQVEQVVIDRSSGYSMLDKAAVKAALQWSFVPAVRAGKAVSAQATVPVRFSLVGRK